MTLLPLLAAMEGSTMCTCLPTSQPLPTYPLCLWRRWTHAWLPGHIRFQLADPDGLNFNYFVQMNGSQVIARRSMPKGYPRELENCNKIFLCSQTGSPTDEKGLNDSIEDKVRISQEGQEEEVLLILLRILQCTSAPVETLSV